MTNLMVDKKVEVRKFSHKRFGNVTTFLKDGVAWFSGGELALKLGYKNTRDALKKHVQECDKFIIKRSHFATLEIPDDFPNRGLSVINESGLNSLIMKSKLPSALEFQHWVTSEVLPSIRENGFYSAVPMEDMFKDPEFLFKVVEEWKTSYKQNQQLKQTIEIMAPKADFANQILATEDCVLVEDLAKLLYQNGVNTGRNRLFKTLVEDGYLYKKPNGYKPTQRAMNLKIFNVEETSINTGFYNEIRFTVKVTPKGQKYFLKKYKPSIVPIEEREYNGR